MTIARCWNSIWLAALLLCCTCLVAAQGLSRLPGAEELITHASDYAARRQYDTAISLLNAALDRYPSYAPLYTALADWQELRALTKLAGGDNRPLHLSSIPPDQILTEPALARELFETYGRAMVSLQDTREVRKRVQRLLKQDYPQQLGQHGIFALPGEPQTIDFALVDTQLPASERGAQRGLIIASSLPPGDAYQRDPKFGRGERRTDPAWQFSRMLYAYSYDVPAQAWILRFRVIWQFAPGKELERLQTAQHIAGVLVRLRQCVEAYSGLTPRFTDKGAVNVWLTEGHDAGAESMREHLYLYNLNAPRSSPEWIRQIAHEFGHQTLPPIAGFTAPEPVASGYLGERLYMHWLLRNVAEGAHEHPWLAEIDGAAFHERFYDPLIRRFAEIGPDHQQLRGTDAAAMDACIGMALYLDAARGSRFLAATLSDMRAPLFAGANGFLHSVQSLEMYLQSLDQPVVTVRMIDTLPTISYRVFLREGNWIGEAQGTNVKETQFDLAVNGKVFTPDAFGRFTVDKLPQGWHTFELKGVEGFPPAHLTAIKLVWKSSGLEEEPPGF